MRLVNQVCIIALILLCVSAWHRHHHSRPEEPDRPLIGGKVYALITYDVGKPPAFLNAATFWDYLDAHVGKGRWHKVESTATFNDDQPDFKALMADPKRVAPDWLTIGTAKRISDSEALPSDEATTEKIIGKYAR